MTKKTDENNKKVNNSLKSLDFTNINDFVKKFGKIAFLEGAKSYDIDDMRDLSEWLIVNGYPVLEVFDLYKKPEQLKSVIEFDADTLIMGTTGLRPDTRTLVQQGLEMVKRAGYSPKNIIDIPMNEYFEFVANIFECNYYSNMLVFCDEINIDNVCEKQIISKETLKKYNTDNSDA